MIFMSKSPSASLSNGKRPVSALVHDDRERPEVASGESTAFVPWACSGLM